VVAGAVATGRDAAKVAAAVGDHDDSTTYAQPTIDDYAERTKVIVAAWKSMDGKQGGDPAKLAEAHRELSAAPRTITPDCIDGQRTGRWMQKKRFWLRGGVQPAVLAVVGDRGSRSPDR
jgi:hypothetical protein